MTETELEKLVKKMNELGSPMPKFTHSYMPFFNEQLSKPLPTTEEVAKAMNDAISAIESGDFEEVAEDDL